MNIDHIGVVVPLLEPRIQRWQQQFGYQQATEPVINTRQSVRVVFLEREGSLPVKLIEPINTYSPVYSFAQRGGGLHHLCFHVPKLDEAIRDLQEKGGRVLTAPQPGEAFDDEPIAFVLAQPCLNVELVATSKRRHRIKPT